MVDKPKKRLTVSKPAEPLNLPIGADKVNNIDQKEQALHSAGITRREALLALKRGLEAKKIVQDKYGTILETVDDHPVQQKSAELILKMFGDMKEFERQLGNVTYNKVVYQWLNAPLTVESHGRS